jgi:hypothetical protein
MAIIIKALGFGTATTSTANFYVVPTGKSALVNNVRLINRATSPATSMNLSVQPSGGIARRIHKKDFSMTAGQSLVLEDAVTLGQGDAIQLTIGSTTPSVDYMVNGVEKD